MLPLKILIAEDNPRDAELLLREIRRAGFDLIWERVDNEVSYLTHLSSEWDLILSDYQMPQFNGLRVLELLKKSGFDIPLILVSGTIGEETAVAAMKMGAADYLLKDRLGRLGSAVTHAVEEGRMRREHRAAEKALRASEARFHSALDDLFEGCQIIGTDWRYLYINKTAAAQGKRAKEELLGRTMWECYPGFETTPLRTVLQRCMRDRVIERIENEFFYPDGTSSWFELSIQPVAEGVFILSLDITGRLVAAKKIREQLSELLRWQEVMFNREDRVQELKNEVNELLLEQNRASRYEIEPPP